MRTDRKWQACAAAPGLLLSVLVPKCPLCAAAWLSTLGIGTALAPWLRPLLFAIAAGLTLATLAACRRRSRQPTCCAREGEPHEGK